MSPLLRLPLLLLVPTALFPACSIIDPAEETPYYVHVDSFSFVPAAGKGTSSHRITSATFYLNNGLLGTHLLPATIPVLGKSGDKVTVTPGIDYSGLSGYQVPYPFYTSDTIRISGNRGEIQNLQPATTYYPNARVVFSEDFDGDNGFTLAGGNVRIIPTTNPSDVFEGSGSGVITVDASQPSSLSASLASFPLPVAAPAYLEMNYTGTQDMILDIGLLTKLKTGELASEYMSFRMKPGEWRKVYVGLQDIVGKFQGSAYNVVIKTSLPEGQSSGRILIDNIKVITF